MTLKSGTNRLTTHYKKSPTQLPHHYPKSHFTLSSLLFYFFKTTTHRHMWLLSPIFFGESIRVVRVGVWNIEWWPLLGVQGICVGQNATNTSSTPFSIHRGNLVRFKYFNISHTLHLYTQLYILWKCKFVRCNTIYRALFMCECICYYLYRIVFYYVL